MIRTVAKIGPEDSGRRMTLAEFEPAEAAPGYLYELGRGAVVVMDVPGIRHLLQVGEIRNQLQAYRQDHPKEIFVVASSMECKILLSEWESERHPDLAVYKLPPPGGPDNWSLWVPELVIEVTSPGSKRRDYQEKREEYLDFGCKEYWIFDADKEEALFLRRFRGQWSEKTLGPSETYQTKLFPGLQFHCGPVFDAAKKYE